MAIILSTAAHKKLQESRQNLSLDENNSNHKFILQYAKTRIPSFSSIKQIFHFSIQDKGQDMKKNGGKRGDRCQ